ncbi:trimeric intracellular cation channel family protein [Burkholderia multivorans]|uniref:trimeric intracellular cation channel family protein n=1 Tax=Burkholderia multivorans TaxID=87883 RepID=UPI000277FD09|nr:trimeric intracellular cation channel family protein [Burkholderia multivorans]EJO54292.1 putative membrane protein [Burkholderia multivorans CF2]MBU9474920.1 trimeric intracellular cation channel family protein [Burkholderia multivorans]
MHTLYLIAIVAEAMSGALMGMRRGMDRFGLALVGAVTALGGGTVRDVLLGHYPLGWIAHPQYLVITLVAATVASRIARHVARMKTLFVTVDALGLAAFTIIGCDVGASTGAAPIIVVLAGAITGVCGGMLRDLLCNEMPLILRRELYASVAFFTGALYVALQHVGIDARVATVVALASGFAMRMLAVRFDWEMRTFGAADVEH